jgi:glycosyltransferase involved in cell wall biosynthesis
VLVSVVMPSYNQARFLPAAIDSVLAYPGELELIVMDGGSTDGSVDVLKRYSDRLTHWESAPDGGQAAAVNAGFERARGDLLCWLNSDDLHLPGALERVVSAVGARPRRVLWYGSAVHLRESPRLEVTLARAQPATDGRIRHEAVVVQPSAFWSRDVWDETGPLDESMNFAFDWEWFIRATDHADFTLVPEVYSVYRLHEAHKTGSGGGPRRREVCEVVRRHGTPEWVARYERLLVVVEDNQARIDALQRRGLPFHRAAMAVAASSGSVPRSVAEARRWSFVMRMYA